MSEIYDREKRIVHNREVFVEWIYDSDSGPPWKKGDGHGPVRESEHEYGKGRHGDKKPGERPLGGENSYLYDWQAAMKKARNEEWGLGDQEMAKLTKEVGRKPTKGQVYERAVERDFQYLKGWLDEDWHYCGIKVTDAETGVDQSLWAIESDAKDYHDDVICELADEIWPDVLKALLEGRAA